MPNALAVLAISERGGLLHAPDMYMNKIAIGPGYPDGIVDLDASAADNLNALARAKGVPVHEITACILDRPRHAELIKAVRETGAAVQLIPDGDIAGVIWTTDSAETGIDIYMGSGGAPEGVLAAAALRCIGGQIQGRLMPLKDEERIRADKMGITDINRKFRMEDMASADVVFSATGVTDGSLLGRRALPRRFRGDGNGRHALEDRHRAPHQDQLPRYRRPVYRVRSRPPMRLTRRAALTASSSPRRSLAKRADPAAGIHASRRIAPPSRPRMCCCTCHIARARPQEHSLRCSRDSHAFRWPLVWVPA